MSDALQTALIALAGVALGGLLTGWFQRANTKTLVAAELEKLRVQLEGEARSRLLGRKQDVLMDAVADIVAAADPELHTQFDYKRVVTLIHRIQLLLDPKKSADARLNDALSKLGFSVQGAVSGQRDTSALLGAQAYVIESARTLLGNAS